MGNTANLRPPEQLDFPTFLDAIGSMKDPEVHPFGARLAIVTVAVPLEFGGRSVTAQSTTIVQSESSSWGPRGPE